LSVKQEKKHRIVRNVVAQDLCTRTHLSNARVCPNTYCNGVYCCTLQQKYTPLSKSESHFTGPKEYLPRPLP
jgi:hypothetical protein